MPAISVIIITFNEEKKIARCIESVLSFADEIVVVDSFSTDRTEEICKSFNTVFIKKNFEGYIEQKNFALSKSTNNLVFSIDADEVVSPELMKSILKVKMNSDADGYSSNRLNIYCGKPIKHSGWYPDKKIRLFNKDKCIWAGINPHDRLDMKEGTTLKQLKGDLIHYSYDNISEHIAQQNRFTDIAAQQYYLKNKSANYFDICFRPPWKFIRDYIFNLGFIDGYFGFIVCKISAHSVLLKYIKLKEIYQNEKSK